MHSIHLQLTPCTTGQVHLLVTNKISPTAVQSLYMALAIDITNGRDLSNEARH